MRRNTSLKTVILLVIVALLFGVMVFGLVTGHTLSPIENGAGTVLSPLQRAGVSVRNWVTGIFVRVDGEKLKQENEVLQGRVLELEAQLQEREALQKENEELRAFFDLKEMKASFDTVYAKVIAYDTGNLSGVVTINKGSLSGIAKNDVVMSTTGLVGVVTEVGLSYAKVSTILNPNSTVGATVVRSEESGILKGKYQLKKLGQCELGYLRDITYAQEGDIVKTSGLGGVYPEGLLVGTVISVSQNSDLTVSAIVQTAVNMNTVNGVMVLTHYTQGE